MLPILRVFLRNKDLIRSQISDRMPDLASWEKGDSGCLLHLKQKTQFLPPPLGKGRVRVGSLQLRNFDKWIYPHSFSISPRENYIKPI